MKRFLPVTFLSVFLVTLTLGIFYLYSTKIVPIRFNSKHPNIVIAKTESFLFNLYANYFLGVGKNGHEVIGVVFTDKQRMGNPVIFDGEPVMASILNSNTPDELLVYIWVSDKVVENKDANKIILDYIVSSISHNEGRGGSLSKMILNIIKTPFYVKAN